jgi:hypothetical protein
MLRRHHGLLFRTCGIALLLLALAPVTAPFSTFDLIDFFRDAPADAASIGQAKSGGDKKLSSAPGVVIDLFLSRPVATRVRALSIQPGGSREPAVIPLRL